MAFAGPLQAYKLRSMLAELQRAMMGPVTPLEKARKGASYVLAGALGFGIGYWLTYDDKVVCNSPDLSNLLADNVFWQGAFEEYVQAHGYTVTHTTYSRWVTLKRLGGIENLDNKTVARSLLANRWSDDFFARHELGVFEWPWPSIPMSKLCPSGFSDCESEVWRVGEQLDKRSDSAVLALLNGVPPR